MADLFNDQLSTISLDDAKAFLCLSRAEAERPSEGPLLDYKEFLPQDIGNNVAAMANSSGGLIFVGVKSVKVKQNIPVAIPGADIGPDAKARITDRILSTVQPRPDFEIQTCPIPGGSLVLALVRIRTGNFPPYEFSQGAAIRIPVRIQDTNRSATVREIESLFNRRKFLGTSREEVINRYLKAETFWPMIDSQTGKARDPFFHKVIVAPRVPLRIRLDSKTERGFENLIRKSFRTQKGFSGNQRFGGFFQTELRSEEGRRHKLWRLWNEGTVGFVRNHSRTCEFEPVGRLAGDLVFFLRLAMESFRESDYYGPLVFADVLSCPMGKFHPSFPPPSGLGDYDHVPFISFEDPRAPGHPNQATFMEEVDWATLQNPQDLIANVVLGLLRELTGARINFEELLQAVSLLMEDPHLEMSW